MYWADVSIETGGTFEYWAIRTPPTSTNCLTGWLAAAVPDWTGKVGAETSVGGVGVGLGLGVSKTQAARGIATANIARINFSFIVERIT